MSVPLLLAVLGGALLHSLWNVIIKGGKEKLFEAALNTLGGGVGVCFILPFLPAPAPASWPLLATSCTIHIAYYTLLSLAYKHADMSYGYTIMRGTAPLLTSLMLALVFGVALSAGGWTGVLLLSAGILTLAVDAVRRGSFSRSGTLLALANAVVVMGYTLSDGYGARLSGHAVSYVCWFYFFNAFPITLIVNAHYGSRFRDYVKQRWGYGLFGGLCSLGSYGITVWAMTRAPMALVAALRETSVIFGMLLAAVFLHERITQARVLAVLLVAGGIMCIKLLA